MNNLVNRWESHEQRFEYWHCALWKILDGIRGFPGAFDASDANPTSSLPGFGDRGPGIR